MPELLAIGERQADRGDRSLGIVGVDVDDRHVEALREVARVARRPALGGVGREADLVVRDEVQRSAGRVAVEAVQVERLGDDALPGERGVAVDEDRAARRSGRGCRRPPSGPSARPARAPRRPDRRPRGGSGSTATVTWISPAAVIRDSEAGEVVLDVARAALRIGDERVDRALALELAQDRRIRASDDVGEHVEPAAMSDADEDLVRARLARRARRPRRASGPGRRDLRWRTASAR